MKLPFLLLTLILAVSAHAGKINQAANSRQWQEVKQLVLAGADINEKCPGWGNTALHQAAYWGEVEMVKFLLAHKADKTIPAKNGRTPLQSAEKHMTVFYKAS